MAGCLSRATRCRPWSCLPTSSSSCRSPAGAPRSDSRGRDRADRYAPAICCSRCMVSAAGRASAWYSNCSIAGIFSTALSSSGSPPLRYAPTEIWTRMGSGRSCGALDCRRRRRQWAGCARRRSGSCRGEEGAVGRGEGGDVGARRGCGTPSCRNHGVWPAEVGVGRRDGREG